jgi:protein TonB
MTSREEITMATLLESGARPFGSSKGVAISMVIHGAIIAAAVVGTASVVLPPREKVEAHPVLYVASPPPPPVHIAPTPLPAVKAPAKAPPAPKRLQAPQPRLVQPQPKVPATPALVAPRKVALSLPAVDLKAAPTISDVVAPPAQEPIKASGVSMQGAVKSSDGEGDEESRRGKGGGGLGSGNSGKAYDENQVDRAVQVSRPATPRYPDALKSVGVQGAVLMRFIVDAEGRVEPGSIDVISTSHKLFADAVRAALLNTRYRPAEAGGHAVRQMVEQTFTFRLDK